MTQEHTATPWQVGEAGLGLWITGPDKNANVICDLVGRGAEGYPVMLTNEDFENAKLIVRAVNAHQLLVDALGEMLNRFYPHACDRGPMCAKCGALKAGQAALLFAQKEI